MGGRLIGRRWTFLLYCIKRCRATCACWWHWERTWSVLVNQMSDTMFKPFCFFLAPSFLCLLSPQWFSFSVDIEPKALSMLGKHSTTELLYSCPFKVVGSKKCFLDLFKCVEYFTSICICALCVCDTLWAFRSSGTGVTDVCEPPWSGRNSKCVRALNNFSKPERWKC